MEDGLYCEPVMEEHGGDVVIDNKSYRLIVVEDNNIFYVGTDTMDPAERCESKVLIPVHLSLRERTPR